MGRSTAIAIESKAANVIETRINRDVTYALPIIIGIESSDLITY
jgi:hypothetical protein